MEGRRRQHAVNRASNVPPIEEVDVERTSSGPSDALSKPLLDETNGLGTPFEDESMSAVESEPAGNPAERFVTTFLINLSATMERFDEQILPAVYRFVGDSFQVGARLYFYMHDWYN
jgi:hypothetical protein